MQQQWGMAMAAALIACEDSVLRLVDVRDGREARSSRYERVDGRGSGPPGPTRNPLPQGRVDSLRTIRAPNTAFNEGHHVRGSEHRRSTESPLHRSA